VQGLVLAVKDLLPFAVVCLRDTMRAEALVLDILVLSLENSWIAQPIAKGQEISHMEFRDEMFRLVWQKAKLDLSKGNSTPNLPYTENAMPFYKLDLEERAALSLRTTSKFEYQSMAYILAMDLIEVEDLVDSARKKILGKDLVEEAEREGTFYDA
jgi:hypothetical protein